MASPKKQFPLRLTAELHHRLALAATACGESMQQYMERCLDTAPQQIARLKARNRELEAFIAKNLKKSSRL